jgi:vacuolar-type H+-ATPase subunit H
MSRPSTGDAPESHGDGACVDILARINEREREIVRILGEAHDAAEAAVVEARRAADESIAARRAEAERLAALAGDEVVALARREADAIRERAALDAATILATPRERIELAAGRMLAIVLPGPPGDGEAP